MNDSKIISIARQYVNASGKPLTEEDVRAVPYAFRQYCEFDYVRKLPRTTKWGRNEANLRLYLEGVREWSISSRQPGRQELLFE